MRLRLTKTGSESGVGLGHVDALVEDVGGGGGGLGEHDRLREGGGVGGAQVGGLRMVGRPRVRSWRRVVTREEWTELSARVRGRITNFPPDFMLVQASHPDFPSL